MTGFEVWARKWAIKTGVSTDDILLSAILCGMVFMAAVLLLILVVVF